MLTVSQANDGVLNYAQDIGDGEVRIVILQVEVEVVVGGGGRQRFCQPMTKPVACVSIILFL